MRRSIGFPRRFHHLIRQFSANNWHSVAINKLQDTLCAYQGNVGNPKWIYLFSFFHRGTWICTDYWNLEVWWPQFMEGAFRTVAKHLMASKELICSSSTAGIYTGGTTDRPEFFCLCCNISGTIHCISLSKFKHNLPLKKKKKNLSSVLTIAHISWVPVVKPPNSTPQKKIISKDN